MKNTMNDKKAKLLAAEIMGKLAQSHVDAMNVLLNVVGDYIAEHTDEIQRVDAFEEFTTRMAEKLFGAKLLRGKE